MKTQRMRFTLPDGSVLEVVPHGATPPSMEDIIDDCPECRAAMARGELRVTTGAELAEIVADPAESRQQRRARLRRARKRGGN